MTRFSRRGHWRTSALGNPHWVDEHDVSREDWNRSSDTTASGHAYFEDCLREVNAHLGVTSTFIHPNATCPVCGARVFFYQNQLGSRVYFDELGKPWPKHHCTDNDEYQGPFKSDGRVEQIAPQWRDKEERSIVDFWLKRAQLQPQQDFWQRYGVSQWSCYRIAKRLNLSAKALLVLEPLSVPSSRRVFLRGDAVPRTVKEGLIVFYYRNWINYWDLRAMEQVEIELQRLSGPAAFVDALIAR